MRALALQRTFVAVLAIGTLAGAGCADSTNTTSDTIGSEVARERQPSTTDTDTPNASSTTSTNVPTEHTDTDTTLTPEACVANQPAVDQVEAYCHRLTNQVPALLEGLNADNPNTYTPTQLECIGQQYAQLPDEDFNQIIAAINQPASPAASQATDTVHEMFTNCDAPIPQQP